MNKKYIQYTVVRDDVPIPEGFMANQVAHAVAACMSSQIAWMSNANVPSEKIMAKINISSPDAFLRNMENMTAWLDSIFYKTVVKAKGPDELNKIASILSENETGYVLIKESGALKIGKLTGTEPDGNREMYLMKKYPGYFSPYTSDNSFVQDGAIYLKKTDEKGTLTTLGIMPLPEKDIPFILRRLPLY